MTTVFYFLIAWVVVAWLLRRFFAGCARLDAWEAERDRRFYDEALGLAAPGSIDDQLDEIRSLPEVPYDWARDGLEDVA